MFQNVRLKMHVNLKGQGGKEMKNVHRLWNMRFKQLVTLSVLDSPDLSIVTRLPFRGNHLLSKIEFNLDVNAPRKSIIQGKQSRKQEVSMQQETMLHAATGYCNETLVMFLVERGTYFISR